ncbi:5-carboxymethyl-2-hydroxymuconate Delta-isomerase [Kiloniella sp. EL199]|uniref:5-carboxymethyl-2-hydroxymuconate Delta-isomerase n=1 Tax=Kiloniella sp. EL199 TaxID=2107581 RepID=UPI000EA0E873|nr:5-carboxymethyl-2-hydroxymuconate Delta-isomerase [Kiloniella sp. EL199]
MPHCIVEYAAPLQNKIDVPNLVENLFEGMIDSGLFDRATIKVRATPSDHFMTGSDKQLYMHTTVKLLPGRSPQQKEMLGERLLEIKTQVLAGTAMLSVEVVDLSEAYFK